MDGRFSAYYRTLPKLRGPLAIALCLAIDLLAADTAPVKLAVEAGKHVIEPDGNLTLRINLLNAENQPAGAPKPLRVILQARQPSSKVDELRSVEFATGQSSAQAAIQPPGNGLVYIWAKHSELLPGGHTCRLERFMRLCRLRDCHQRDLAHLPLRARPGRCLRLRSGIARTGHFWRTERTPSQSKLFSLAVMIWRVRTSD